jgi:hypothetical protein
MKRFLDRSVVNDLSLELLPVHVWRKIIDSTGNKKHKDQCLFINALAETCKKLLTIVDQVCCAYCEREACGAKIKRHETYFLLAGGKVVNCFQCASAVEYRVKMGKNWVTHKRGWDEVARKAPWLGLKRIML